MLVWHAGHPVRSGDWRIAIDEVENRALQARSSPLFLEAEAARAYVLMCLRGKVVHEPRGIQNVA